MWNCLQTRLNNGTCKNGTCISKVRLYWIFPAPSLMCCLCCHKNIWGSVYLEYGHPRVQKLYLLQELPIEFSGSQLLLVRKSSVGSHSVTVRLSGVVATRSVRCETPYSHTMGRHLFLLTTEPFPRVGRHSVTDVGDNGGCTLVLRDLKTTPNLAGVLCG
jgi:hypothetical protein